MKHSRRLFLLLLFAVSLLFGLGAPASAQFVSRFELRESVISPDGDGKQDSTRVRYALTDSVIAASVVIFEADSITPVYTVRAAAPDVPGTHDYYWRGQRDDGSLAAEGAYVATLQATRRYAIDSLVTEIRRLPVFVDVTPPQVQILSVIPNPYAPGVPGSRPALEVSHTIANASPVWPGRTPDRLIVAFSNPNGAPVEATVTTDPPFTGSSGNYVTFWDATENASLLDGEYQVVLTVDDAAGYSAQSVYHFELDSAVPAITITAPPENAHVNVVPDSIRGRAFDRHGVDSLYVKYPGAPYQRVTGTRVLNDSLVFAVTLADSVAEEGTYTFAFRAVDGVGRSNVHEYTMTYDLTAPATPVLDAFSGTWRTERFPVSGTADNGGDTGALVRIARNGTVVDSIPTALSDRFTVDVPLVVGRNEIVAYQRDGAGNVSGPSNRILVDFASSGGVYFPVPFTPGDSFDVNATRTARSVTLRVFDVTGDLVTFFEDGTSSQYYTFRWNGRNSSDREVRRGPLVAVATVQYEDGSRDVFREVFLFDSNP